MDYNTLKNNIKILRTNSKMNQTDFARSIGITQSTLSSYEKGNATPSLDVLIAMATNFHVSLDWLTGISDSEQNLSSLADVINMMLQLNEINEVRYELEINDKLANDTEDDTNKWYAALKFFGNSQDHPYNEDICLFLSSLEENRTSFESYFTTKEMFDLWREKQAEYYKSLPLTNRVYPELDNATRIKLRNELLEKQFNKNL